MKYGGKHPSHWEGRPLQRSQRQLCSFLAHCHAPFPGGTDGDATVGRFVFIALLFICSDTSKIRHLRLKNRKKKPNRTALHSTVVKGFNREPHLISLGAPLKVVMQTHSGYGKIGSLNHFYTPGSFPDSRFIQLKSHSSSPRRSNTSKYFKRHSVARTLT